MFKLQLCLCVFCVMAAYLMKGTQTKTKADPKTYKGKIAVECVAGKNDEHKPESTINCCKGVGSCRKVKFPSRDPGGSNYQHYCLVNTEEEAEKVKQCCKTYKSCNVLTCTEVRGRSEKAENATGMAISKSC